MSEELKLITALCEAMGFDVERTEDYKVEKTDSLIIPFFNTYQKRRLVTKKLSTKYKIDNDGMYESELIKPEISYKLIPRAENND